MCSTEELTSPNDRQTLVDLVLNSDPLSGVLIALHPEGMIPQNSKYQHFIIAKYLNQTVITNVK